MIIGIKKLRAAGNKNQKKPPNLNQVAILIGSLANWPRELAIVWWEINIVDYLRFLFFFSSSFLRIFSCFRAFRSTVEGFKSFPFAMVKFILRLMNHIPFWVPAWEMVFLPRVFTPVWKKGKKNWIAKRQQEIKHTRGCSSEGKDDFGFPKVKHALISKRGRDRKH